MSSEIGGQRSGDGLIWALGVLMGIIALAVAAFQP